jgi:hypothetical protein
MRRAISPGDAIDAIRARPLAPIAASATRRGQPTPPVASLSPVARSAPIILGTASHEHAPGRPPSLRRYTDNPKHVVPVLHLPWPSGGLPAPRGKGASVLWRERGR